MPKHLDIIVTGTVQKVGLRFLSLKKAYELHLRGWVKYGKERDTVLYEIEGDEADLAVFLRWLNKGTSFADIKSIDLQEGEFKNYPTFEIIHKTVINFQPA